MKVPSVALSLVFAAGFVQTATVIVQLAGNLTGYQDPLYGWERHAREVLWVKGSFDYYCPLTLDKLHLLECDCGLARVYVEL